MMSHTEACSWLQMLRLWCGWKRFPWITVFVARGALLYLVNYGDLRKEGMDIYFFICFK